jgi:ribosomal protein L24
MAKTTTTALNVGDLVQVKDGKEHDSMTKGKRGRIVEIGTPALGIRFEGMGGVHKWYTDDEVKKL